MIQIMIVDDEPIFREFLRNYIPWLDYGFEVIAEAKNGVEALSLADQLQPDVVLTDISMPQMDGLEFAQKLLEIAPDTGIVFITGHDEFEYVRKAIRIGACDYILKPFEKEELILTLLKLKDNIREASNLSTPEYDLDTSLIMPLLTSKYHHNSQALHNKLKNLGLDQPNATYVVTCLDIDHLDYNVADQEEKMLWRFCVSNILSELLDENVINYGKNRHVFYDYEGNITTIIQLPIDFNLDTYLSVYKHLMVAVQKYLKFDITVGIGSCQTGSKGIANSYNEALSALHHKYISKNNQIIHYNNIPDASKDFSFYNAAFSENLLTALRCRDKDSITSQFNDLYRNITKKNVSYDFTRIIQMGLISLLFTYISQAGKSMELIFGNQYSPYQSFEKADTLKLQQELILDLYYKTIAYFDSNQITRSLQVAQQAKEYVNTHYMDSTLTVQEIANNQYINQTYLRSMFKKEMGLNISDYMTKIRMEKASSLLQQKTYRLIDIAEAVGYSDSSYFSKCFKKNFGISPSQYEISN